MKNLITINSIGLGLELSLVRKPEISDISAKISIEKKINNIVVYRIKPQLKEGCIAEVNDESPIKNNKKQVVLSSLNEILMGKEVEVVAKAPFSTDEPYAIESIKQFCNEVILHHPKTQQQLIEAVLSLFTGETNSKPQEFEGQCGQGCTCGFNNLSDIDKVAYFRNVQILENLDEEIANKQSEIDNLISIRTQYMENQEKILNNLNKNSNNSKSELKIIPIF